MTTLHTLRRQYALSFSELAQLTAIPARRLAAFEYHGLSLDAEEQQSLTSLFGLPLGTLESGCVNHIDAQPTLSTTRAQTLLMLAATTTLAVSLRLGEPLPPADMLSSFVPLTRPVLIEDHAYVAQNDIVTEEQHSSVPVPDTAASNSITSIHPAHTFEVNLNSGRSSEPAIKQEAAAHQVAPSTHRSSRQPQYNRAFPMSPLHAEELIAEHERVQLAEVAAVREQDTPQPFTAGEMNVAVHPPETNAMGTSSKYISPPKKSKQTGPIPGPAQSLSSSGLPHRCPIEPQRGQPSISQGYGIGTHAPAHTWGALDLVVAGGATEGTIVVATHAGHVQVVLDSWPGGNYISISGNAGWRTAYAHLKDVFVRSGQYVEAGTPIGTIGSTGYSTGPHLHYETWRDGVNVDPSPVVNCK